MNNKSIVIPWLSLSLLLQGMLLSFCSAFRCSISLPKHILPCVLTAGAAVFVGIKLKRKYAFLVFSFVSAALMIYAYFVSERLGKDFLSFVFYINKKAVDYNGKPWFGFEGVRGAMDNNMLLRLMGIVMAFYIAFFAFRMCSRTYGFLPVYIVSMFGMLLGTAPDKKSVFFLIIGIVMAFSWISCQEKGGRHSFVQRGSGGGGSRAFPYVVLFVLLMAGLFGAQLLEMRTSTKILAHSGKYLIRQHQIERELVSAVERIGQRISGQFGLDSDGRLSNTAPVYLQDTVMELTVSERPSKSFYLKGFVGGSYEDGRWFPCETETLHGILSRDGEMSLWDANYQFARYCQKNILGGWDWDSDGLMRMKMEYVGKGKRSKYAYIPYYSDMYSLKNSEGKRCVIIDGENGLKRQNDIYYLSCYNGGEDITSLARDPDLSGGNYLSLSAMQITSYNQYVSAYYGRLSADKLKKLQRFIDESQCGGLDAYTAAGKIRDALRRVAVYSKDLDPVPAGVDYVEYFLYSQRKGYCEHFATAGTLLLRAEGFPARYVSGYKVPPERFQKNEDGTYTAKVLDEDAHAWTEIFTGHASGWYPVEMTPESGASPQSEDSQMPKTDEEERITPSKTPQATKLRDTEEPENTPKSSQSAETKEAQKKNGSGTGVSKKQIGISIGGFVRRYWAAIIFTVVLLILTIRRIIYPRICRRKYDRKLCESKGDMNAFICIRTERFLFFLKHGGVRVPFKYGESQWIKETETLCGEAFPKGTWERMDEIRQRAEYARDYVDEKEVQFYLSVLEKAEQILLAGRNRWRRWHLRLLFWRGQ